VSVVIIVILLTSLFTQEINGAQVEREQAITLHACWQNLPPEINEKIIKDHFIDSCNKIDQPQHTHNHIVCMGLLNKEMHTFVHQPDTTRSIIARLSDNNNQGEIAQKIGTVSTLNYFKNNKILHKYIHCMGKQSIKKLLAKGADVNYYPSQKKPLLFASQLKTEKMNFLLQHGANPNVIFKNKTILHVAIEKNKPSIVKLLLSYSPEKSCLPTAIFLQNHPLIHLILKHGHISEAELNESLGMAIQQKDKETAQLLIDAGAHLDLYLAELMNFLEAV
jgi:hypothetical protein